MEVMVGYENGMAMEKAIIFIDGENTMCTPN